MISGEPLYGRAIVLNDGRPTITLRVANTGDRAIQVAATITSTRPTMRLFRPRRNGGFR
jgi:urease beta subunit